MDYKARFYDPTIGRFIQPDSIIPSYANPQTLNRFSYVLNTPVLLNDPSGHRADCGTGFDSCDRPSSVVTPKEPLKGQGEGKGGQREHHGCAGESLCDDIIFGLQVGAGLLDFLGVVVSFGEVIGAAPTVLIGVGMSIASPSTAPATLGATLMMDAAIAGTFGPVENNLGYASAILTGSADILAGNTYISQNGDLYVGKSSLTSGATAAIGTIPEVGIDFAASMYQLRADMEGRGGSVNVSQYIRDITYMPASMPRRFGPGQR